MATNIITFVQSCLEACQSYYRTFRWQLRRYQNTLSWHFHKLRKAPKRLQPITATNLTPSDVLHRLPPEIRLQIYRYLVPNHYIIQPEFDNGKLRARFGLLAAARTDFKAPKFIRSDLDPPSAALRMILEDGGSFLHQTSPRLPSTKTTVGRLICGDGEAWNIGQFPDFFGGGACSSLLRTSRLVHHEVVDVLYGRHTFSFVGPEMLQIFMEQASLEGLRSVRHVHLAVPLPACGSSMEIALLHLDRTMKRVASDLSGLQHLDVEMVVHQGPRQDAAMLARFVSRVFGHLPQHSLEDFVLKICVLRKDTGGKKYSEDTESSALGTWDIGEYMKLKTSLVRR